MAARRPTGRRAAAQKLRRRPPRRGPKLQFHIGLPELLARRLIKAAADALTSESEIVGDLVEEHLGQRRTGTDGTVEGTEAA